MEDLRQIALPGVDVVPQSSGGFGDLLQQRLVVVGPDADRGNRDAGFPHVLREAHELPAVGLADGGIAVRQEDDPIHDTGFLSAPARLLEGGLQSVVH